ncbi:MAG: ATP synthase F1 subunit epsilon [Bacteroidales bacterium]|jgi:F-type H+-transporting ATPase subunit epsilon|nr:ATP synthase F1 subunit epsilon [Bacteroidales bacterium]
MKIEIVTPEKTAYQGDCTLVQLPGSNGLFEVLVNHAPMITTLAEGKAKVIDNQSNTIFFNIKGGVVEVLANKVLVLAENCEKIE